MEIPINKTVKVSEHNGSLRMSIPNMVHTITDIEEGDFITYNTMDYEKESNQIKIILEINKEKNHDKTNHLRYKL